MSIDGAHLSSLSESLPKVIHTSIPVVLVTCTVSTTDPDPKLYRCPVYKRYDIFRLKRNGRLIIFASRARRTDQNYIMEVELRTSISPDHWVERGVALLASI